METSKDNRDKNGGMGYGKPEGSYQKPNRIASKTGR